MSEQPIISNPYRAPRIAYRPRYACPECGPLGSNEFTLDHRCARCNRPVLAIRKLNERHDREMVSLPRRDLELILAHCGCPYTYNALHELLEAHDADL